MSSDTFGDRADALENAFFNQVDAKLTEQMRLSLERDKTADELASLSGINSSSVLDALVAAGVTGRSMTALRIFPLVAVAWADEIIQENEREIVMTAAAKQGLPPKTPAGMLLDQWLTHKPENGVFEAWEAYARSLVGKLEPEEAKSLKHTIEKEIKAVAQAAGGVLGWAAVSKGESAVMRRILLALDGQ